MFIFRRITKEDNQLKLKTGNEAFDEIAPNGLLETFIKQDSIEGGQFITYLLLEQKDFKNKLLGLLRYRNSTEKEFLEQFLSYVVHLVYIQPYRLECHYQSANRNWFPFKLLSSKFLRTSS